MPEGPRKRSLTLAGHRTSISLEPEFWEALQALARSDVDESRGGRNLSSALRVFVLRRTMREAPEPERTAGGQEG